jgi:hypothetical protein
MTDDAEDVLDDIKNQRRTNTEATANESDEQMSLADAVADALRAIDEDETNPTMGFRDENLVALLDGLEATGELVRVVRDGRTELGIESDGDPTRSEACRLLMRVGLQTLDDSILDDAAEGRKQFLEAKAESESF